MPVRASLTYSSMFAGAGGAWAAGACPAGACGLPTPVRACTPATMIIPTLRPIAHVIRMAHLHNKSASQRHPALERGGLDAEQLRGAGGSAHAPAGRLEDGSDVVHFDLGQLPPLRTGQ